MENFLKENLNRDYCLIDIGEEEKLEKFGPVTLIRPDLNARMKKSLKKEIWFSEAHAKFIQKSSASGLWIKFKDIPDEWHLQFRLKDIDLRFKLALTKFKHIGIFPEQRDNWSFIIESIMKIKGLTPKILNLFAYTGGASLAARAAGAEVTHVDSLKQIVRWGKENMSLSGLNNIRWIVDDSIKFIKREIRRGHSYNGIILDPPVYGKGPKGETWKLERDIWELMELTKQVLDKERYFIVLSIYSSKISYTLVKRLIRTSFPDEKNPIIEELSLTDSFGKKLRSGIVTKLWKL